MGLFELSEVSQAAVVALALFLGVVVFGVTVWWLER